MADFSTHPDDILDDVKDSEALLHREAQQSQDEGTMANPRRSLRHRTNNKGKNIRMLTYYVLATILCVSLVIDIALRLRTQRGCSSHSDSKLHETIYGSNESYMSLDHKYDHLWDQEYSANNAVVYIPEYEGQEEDEIEAGAVTMYAESMYSGLLSHTNTSTGSINSTA